MNKQKLKVGVLFGGLSGEKEISLATGRYITSLVDTSKFEPIPLYMSYSGKIYKLPMKLVLMNKTEDIEAHLDEAEFIGFDGLAKTVDIVFNALLGKYGEDGAITGVFELLNIPYTGSGVLTSAILMNKEVTKAMLKGRPDIKLAKDMVIELTKWNNDKENIIEKLEELLGYPMIVKPTREGSSLGVSYVENRDELIHAIEEAFKLDSEILVEEYIKGIEFMCVVLGNDNPVAMLPTEAEYPGKIFTYDEKYLPGQARYYTPPRGVSKEVIEKLRNIAIDLYKYFGLKGYGRVDGFIVGEDIYITELHTGTIMVPSSYVFQQSALSDVDTGKIKGMSDTNSIKGMQTKGNSLKVGKTGLSPRELVTTIIYLALDAHKDKKGPLN